MNGTSFANFESMEKKYMSLLRKKINESESKTDLVENFSSTVSNFLNQVFNESIAVHDNDIIFKPDTGDKFILSTKLKESEQFLNTWNNSNLPSFIGKVADTTYHRYIHLDKHTEKTEKKIRQSTSKNH